MSSSVLVRIPQEGTGSLCLSVSLSLFLSPAELKQGGLLYRCWQPSNSVRTELKLEATEQRNRNLVPTTPLSTWADQHISVRFLLLAAQSIHLWRLCVYMCIGVCVCVCVKWVCICGCTNILPEALVGSESSEHKSFLLELWFLFFGFGFFFWRLSPTLSPLSEYSPDRPLSRSRAADLWEAWSNSLIDG